MTKYYIFGLLLLFLTSAAQAQKVKYKDIFPLLSTKQYEQAEPFLKKYLKDNDDNPNAFLFMAIIYHEKAGKTDILTQTVLVTSLMDSAIQFYDKANKMIDEREVRRNKEYYQAYNRRDLRTGEFGVKLSDIQFDLQKKIEGLKERIDRVKMVRYYFSLSDSLYKKCNALYVSLQKEFETPRRLYLRANEKTVNDLSALSVRFDSCTKAFENYKSSASSLGKIGYNQVWNLAAIENFSKEGVERADFYQEELKIWDYRKFAEQTKTVIEKEIFPMREHLVSYDIEINKLRDKLNADSVSVRNDLTKLIDKLLYDQLRKYDPDPLPMSVFSLKTADLEYRSVLLENKPLRDTADIPLQIKTLRSELKILDKLDSISSRLSDETIEERAPDYNHFIVNTYSSVTVLKSYVGGLKEYSQREKRKKNDALANRLKALNYIVDGADSIPLKEQILKNRYKPLYTADEKYTLGLHLTDSLNATGYFYTITSARKPEVKVVFPVDKSSFKERRLPQIKGLSYSDTNGQIYFVLLFSEQIQKEKYPVTLAKIYRSDGLAWSNNYQLAFIPKEIALKPDTGEVTIKNDTQQMVIDKNGKLLK